jgi:hypothetical protein
MTIDRDVVAAPGASPVSPELRSPSRDGDGYDQLLREAITALTAAARLTRTECLPDGTAASRKCDWAEFVTPGPGRRGREHRQRRDRPGWLEDRPEHQRQQDWVAYGAALATHIRAQVARIEGLRVPVVVHVDVDLVPAAGPSGTGGSGMGESLPERLLQAAVLATPLPGHGRTPLERLEQAG